MPDLAVLQSRGWKLCKLCQPWSKLLRQESMGQHLRQEWRHAADSTSETSPPAKASLAVSFLLNKSIWLATEVPRIFGKVCEEQASGVRARAVKGTWKVAVSDAYTTSIRPSTVQPEKEVNDCFKFSCQSRWLDR